MKKTTPELLISCMKNENNEIILQEDIMKKARASVEAMIRFT